MSGAPPHSFACLGCGERVHAQERDPELCVTCLRRVVPELRDALATCVHIIESEGVLDGALDADKPALTAARAALARVRGE